MNLKKLVSPLFYSRWMDIMVIESREKINESKDPNTIEEAVRVAHLNLVDLAGSERASETGAVGLPAFKRGGQLNRSLLTLSSVIAKLSEGESRVKTIKNCPEVNEVLDDGTLLKSYQKEICELRKQLTEMSQESSICSEIHARMRGWHSYC
ncbi:Centromere-associated protein E [Acropora cervicornis]|uniref:Centromere-associated protein E n=1 Tax=Acropora cervicornis TaxID=6130 RepID=A0AAD9Q3A1_ACRCE|nr:Centromere-associated protein E [Acropora cervicornis]